MKKIPKPEKSLASDFELFAGTESTARTADLKSLTANMEKDLVTSPKKLAFSYIAGSVIGYFASLAICAQCSVGLTPFAWQMSSIIHEIPDPWCPFVCGTIFGVAPFIVTLIFFNRFQHRYLLYRMWWLMIAVPVIGGISMTAIGGSHDTAWDLQWIFTAILTPYIGEGLTGWLLRQNKWATPEFS